MTKQTGMTDRIRQVLRAAAGPLQSSEIMDALGDGNIVRNSVSSLLNQRVRAGEFRVSIISARPHYEIVKQFQMPMPQRSAAKSIVLPPAPLRAPHSSAQTAPDAPAAPSSPPPPKPKRSAAAPHAANEQVAAETITMNVTIEITGLAAAVRMIASALNCSVVADG